MRVTLPRYTKSYYVYKGKLLYVADEHPKRNTPVLKYLYRHDLRHYTSMSNLNDTAEVVQWIARNI